MHSTSVIGYVGMMDTISTTEIIGGIAVPVDPMDFLHCDSCQ